MWLWILSAVFLILVWAAWWFLLPVEGAPGGEIFPTWVANGMPRGVRSDILASGFARRSPTNTPENAR